MHNTAAFILKCCVPCRPSSTQNRGSWRWGCGTGNYLVGICEAVGCHFIGSDPAEEMLAQACSRNRQVQLVRGSAEALDFPPEFFDLVFSVDVIHHLYDRPRFSQEAVRVLRPGGRVCTVTDSEWVIRNRQPLAVYFPETVPVELERYLRIHDLWTNMLDAGVVAIEEQTVEFVYELRDIEPYRARVYSSLRLITEGAFRQGITRMEKDLSAGPIPCVSRYTLVWGSKPSSE